MGYDLTLMYAMHVAVRRDLEHIAKVTARTDDDPRRILANAVGWELFKKALHIHHSTEDDALWPPMREALADRPDGLAVIDAMEADHAQIDPMIAAVDAALADRDGGPGRLGDLTDELATKLTAHLKREEAEALPMIDSTLTLEQVIHFGQLHASRNGPDGPRLVPWLLDGADEQTVATMMRLLPDPVKAAYQNEWKPAWAALDKWNAAKAA